MKKSLLSVLVGSLLLLAGCATPQGSLRSYQVAGGKTVRLRVARDGALPSQTEDIKIEVTGFMIDGKTAELTYTFGFTAKKKQTPRAVLVEDVTGASAVPLVEDQSPTLEAGGYWKGESTPRRAGDPSLVWLSTPGNTEKVFKFTITLADGRVEEIYQASLWSGQMKPVIKQALKLP